MAKKQSSTLFLLALALFLTAVGIIRFVSPRSQDDTNAPNVASTKSQATANLGLSGSTSTSSNGKTSPTQGQKIASSDAELAAEKSEKADEERAKRFEEFENLREPDDGGKLAVLAEKRYLVLVKITANSAQLQEMYLKDLPYRQINAEVKSSYTIDLINEAGAVVFHAPIEVDNLCLGQGPDHLEEHAAGDVIFPHETTALFPIPELTGDKKPVKMLVKRLIDELDEDEVVLGSLDLK